MVSVQLRSPTTYSNASISEPRGSKLSSKTFAISSLLRRAVFTWHRQLRIIALTNRRLSNHRSTSLTASLARGRFAVPNLAEFHWMFTVNYSRHDTGEECRGRFDRTCSNIETDRRPETRTLTSGMRPQADVTAARAHCLLRASFVSRLDKSRQLCTFVGDENGDQFGHVGVARVGGYEMDRPPRLKE